jgi:hypothetical protein
MCNDLGQDCQKACGTAGGMDNGVFQLIRWVDLRRSLSTWRILVFGF